MMPAVLPLHFTAADRSIWPLFAEYHYLPHPVHPACEFFLAWSGPHPVGIAAMLHAMGYPGYYRISRLVVLPTWRGHRIGGRLLDWVAEYYASNRHARRVSVVTALWPIIDHCEASPAWLRTRRMRNGNVPQHRHTEERWSHRTSYGRAVMSFRYIPSAQRISSPPRPCL